MNVEKHVSQKETGMVMELRVASVRVYWCGGVEGMVVVMSVYMFEEV